MNGEERNPTLDPLDPDGDPARPPVVGGPAAAAPAADRRLLGAPAGFWRRVLALAVDLAVMAVLWRIGESVGQPLARFDLAAARAFDLSYNLVMPAAYFVLAHGTGGRTLGKRLLGARVVGPAGAPVGYLRALGRFLAGGLSVATLGLGFLMAAFRRDRRALHDLVAGTRVCRTGAGAGRPRA